jgi:hypothetical protein
MLLEDIPWAPTTSNRIQHYRIMSPRRVVVWKVGGGEVYHIDVYDDGWNVFPKPSFNDLPPLEAQAILFALLGESDESTMGERVLQE